MKEFMDKIRGKFSPEEIEELRNELDERIKGDRDQWGPCCPSCPHRDQIVKGCGLWCLPRFKGGLR